MIKTITKLAFAVLLLSLPAMTGCSKLQGEETESMDGNGQSDDETSTSDGYHEEGGFWGDGYTEEGGFWGDGAETSVTVQTSTPGGA